MEPAIRALPFAALALTVPAHARDEAAGAVPLDEGVIVAQSSGATTIMSRAVGANRAVTRAVPFRCTRAVDLHLERVAALGDRAKMRREMSSRNASRRGRDDVIAGIEAWAGVCIGG